MTNLARKDISKRRNRTCRAYRKRGKQVARAACKDTKTASRPRRGKPYTYVFSCNYLCQLRYIPRTILDANDIGMFGKSTNGGRIKVKARGVGRHIID